MDDDFNLFLHGNVCASRSKNQRNQIVKKRKYPRGVFKKKDKKKLKAQIIVNNKAIHLGYFECPLMASITYEAARVEHFGSNFKGGVQ